MDGDAFGICILIFGGIIAYIIYAIYTAAPDAEDRNRSNEEYRQRKSQQQLPPPSKNEPQIYPTQEAPPEAHFVEQIYVERMAQSKAANGAVKYFYTAEEIAAANPKTAVEYEEPPKDCLFVDEKRTAEKKAPIQKTERDILEQRLLKMTEELQTTLMVEYFLGIVSVFLTFCLWAIAIHFNSEWILIVQLSLVMFAAGFVKICEIRSAYYKLLGYKLSAGYLLTAWIPIVNIFACMAISENIRRDVKLRSQWDEKRKR